MSAFKPFVPDVVPQQQQQQQPQQYHPHNRHQRHYSQQQQQLNTSGQTPVGSGVVFQPITHPPSFCGSASTLPRGQSPDNGYLSLEHPSRTASFVSQVSAQFSPSTGDLHRKNGGPFDQSTPKEGHTPGRSQQTQDSSSDSPNSTFASYRSSQSSVNSSAFNNSWTSKKSGSGFDFRCAPAGRRQGEEERQNMYSTVLGGGQRNGGNASAGSEAKLPLAGAAPSSGHHRDPPPSISDIKNALMIKDTELRMMRETMTKNESAILQVFEDKKRKWQVEMLDRKKEWENQLQALQKKAWKTEQLLQFQVAKLHQENKKLQTRTEELETEKKRLEDQCQGLQTELNGLKSDMRGLLEDVGAKDLLDQFQSSISIDADRYKIDPDCCKVWHSSPSNTLVSPIRPNGSADVGNGGNAMRQMRRKYPIQETLQGLNRTSSELSLVKTDVRTLSLPELQRELENARRDVDAYRLELEQERQNWKAEKEKVIDYQKRLQLSYLQILHKNRLLELDVQQLTGEMAELDIRQLSRDDSVVSKASQGETVY